MLQKCTALFLLLAFLASTFSRAVIVADFYANQDHIAKNLCENRDKPMMHCCGRCQLRKRLAHQDEQDKKNPERRTENNKEILFLEASIQGLNTPHLSPTILSYRTHPDKTPVDRPADIFHPPA